MLQRKTLSYQIDHCLKVKPSFHKKLFQKEKMHYCYGFMACWQDSGYSSGPKYTIILIMVKF